MAKGDQGIKILTSCYEDRETGAVRVLLDFRMPPKMEPVNVSFLKLSPQEALAMAEGLEATAREALQLDSTTGRIIRVEKLNG